MNRALVTGGAGFIGSNLVRALLGQGVQVRILDNLSSGSLDNLGPLSHGIELVEADVRDRSAVNTAMRDVDVVFHEAAIASVPLSMEQPDLAHQVNVGGTLNVLEAARAAGVRRLVYAASSAVYGNDPTLPKCEEMPADPQSPYAATKYAGELYAQVHARALGLETVCLRYFNVFGPGQSPRSQYAAVIPAFLSTVLAGQRPVIYGDGEQSRDFVFIDDVVRANLAAAQAPSAVCGQSYNIAGGRGTSLNELLREIGLVLGREIRPVFGPERPGDVRHSYGSIDLARERLAWVPAVSLREGLERSLDWYRQGF